MALNEQESLKALEARMAVRFLIKKSKRMRNIELSEICPPPAEKTKTKEKSENSEQRPLTPECLMYLGLSHNQAEAIRERKSESRQEEFPFAKPRVLECDICVKVFFHSIPFRRHMIRHIKKTKRCAKCGKGFKTIIHKRRHQLSCRG